MIFLIEDHGYVRPEFPLPQALVIAQRVKSVHVHKGFHPVVDVEENGEKLV